MTSAPRPLIPDDQDRLPQPPYFPLQRDPPTASGQHVNFKQSPNEPTIQSATTHHAPTKQAPNQADCVKVNKRLRSSAEWVNLLVLTLTLTLIATGYRPPNSNGCPSPRTQGHSLGQRSRHQSDQQPRPTPNQTCCWKPRSTTPYATSP